MGLILRENGEVCINAYHSMNFLSPQLCHSKYPLSPIVHNQALDRNLCVLIAE